MARILLIVAILLTAGSAFLSLQTKGKIKQLRENLDTAQAAEEGLQKDKAKAVEEAKKAKDALTLAETAKDAAEKDAKTAKDAADKAKTEITDLTAKVTKSENEVKDLNEKIAALKEAATEATATGTAAAPDPELNQKLAAAEAAAAEQKQIAASLEERVKDAEARVQSLEAEAARKSSGQNRTGVTGKVLAVNPNWNFAVLSFGDRQGIVPNSEVVVRRHGSTIGRLRITSVRPGASVGDIISRSLAKNDTVRPGDEVVTLAPVAPVEAPVALPAQPEDQPLPEDGQPAL